MEYLDGETLHAAVRGQRLELPAAIDVLLQLCDALQCAHERGVVHRDLKPDNVFLVTRGGRHHFVKLVDFGIAKLRDARPPAADRTSAGLIVGTPEYMAPEQCDDGAIDARTDVYALGVMAYELLAGRLPFQGKTVTQLLLAHLQQAPPPLSRFVKGIDPELERAIMKALAKAPADRHADMAQFAEALRPVLARLEQPAEAAAAPPPARAPAPPPAAGRGRPAPAAPPPTPVRVELRAGDATRRLVAVEVTRGGLFLGAETDLPPLFSRVALTVSHPSLRTRLELSGEVVRHVSAAEAARWHMAPGFAVQLVELTPGAARGPHRPGRGHPRRPAAGGQAPAPPRSCDRAAARAGGAARLHPLRLPRPAARRRVRRDPQGGPRAARPARGHPRRAPRPPTSTPAPPPCWPGSTWPSTPSRCRPSAWSTTRGAATTWAWPAAWRPGCRRP